MDITIEKEDIFIEELLKLSKREILVTHFQAPYPHLIVSRATVAMTLTLIYEFTIKLKYDKLLVYCFSFPIPSCFCTNSVIYDKFS